MAPEILCEWRNRTPFQPFRIHVVGNVHYEVARPGFVLVGRTVVFVGLRKDVESPFFDDPVLVPLKYITSIEPLA